jgi:hypothetical protein
MLGDGARKGRTDRGSEREQEHGRYEKRKRRGEELEPKKLSEGEQKLYREKGYGKFSKELVAPRPKEAGEPKFAKQRGTWGGSACKL